MVPPKSPLRLSLCLQHCSRHLPLLLLLRLPLLGIPEEKWIAGLVVGVWVGGGEGKVVVQVSGGRMEGEETEIRMLNKF